MEKPNLVKWGLAENYEIGYSSNATNMMYNYIKKTPEEISQIIKETWTYIKSEDKNNHILAHFIYLLKCEIRIEWIKDISFDIIEYSLNSNDEEVIDNTIQLIETWNENNINNLLYNTEIKINWLNEQKEQVLKDLNYKSN